MQTLTIEQPRPFLVPPGPVHAIVVGAGGTGSHIIQSLARIAAHVGPGAGLAITVIDGDTVEPKNVGRQLFSRADVGLNKAQALAARFSSVFGLRITAVPEMATEGLLESVARPPGGRSVAPTRILIGAVDTPRARRIIHAALGRGVARIWLDCGNEESSGQVAAGTTANREILRRSLAGLAGVCGELPAPSLIYPNLIADPPAPAPGDCAAQMEQNLQGLMVNQAVAAVAAQYLHDLIIARRLTTFCTSISLAPLAMRSTPTTEAAIVAAAGLDAAPEPARVKPKKGRAA